MNYDILNEARLLLQLPEFASMELIKDQYRKLMKQWHPDHCKEEPEKCEKMSRRLTEAYRMIQTYCAHYRYSFTRETVERHLSEKEWWLNRFGSDPMWAP